MGTACCQEEEDIKPSSWLVIGKQVIHYACVCWLETFKYIFSIHSSVKCLRFEHASVLLISWNGCIWQISCYFWQQLFFFNYLNIQAVGVTGLFRNQFELWHNVFTNVMIKRETKDLTLVFIPLFVVVY